MAMQEWQDTSVTSPQTFCKSLLAAKYMAIHIKKKKTQGIRDLCDGSVKRSINWASFKLQNSTWQDWHSSTPHLLPRLSSYSLSVVITLWSNNRSLTILPSAHHQYTVPMLCVPSRVRNSNGRWCCGWRWRSQPPRPQSARLRWPGWSAPPCGRPRLGWVTPFFPILALSLLMFFSSFTLPKGRVRISSPSNKVDRTFRVRTCFGFHPTHPARGLWLYQNSLLLALRPFFCLADFTTWTCFDVHCALLCNGDRSPRLPLVGHVSFIYLGPIYS